MIHLYVSMPEREHRVYELVGSVSNDKLATLLSEPLREFGGRLITRAKRLPLLQGEPDDVPARFYVLTYEHGDEPAAYINQQLQPVDKMGRAV